MIVDHHDGERGTAFRGTERYRLKGRLGAGGMGVVYLVHDEERGIDVALKVLPRDMSAGDVDRLKREFRTVADVSHPNLVALYELVVDGSQCFFTMERIDGVELVDWLAGTTDDRTSSPSFARWTPSSSSEKSGVPPSQNGTGGSEGVGVRGERPASSDMSQDATVRAGRAASDGTARTSDPPIDRAERPAQRIDLDRLRAALRQLAEALLALHQAGQLHLDLKPSNVLVRRDGRVVVLDFGIARQVGTDDVSMSHDGTSISGTPAYMAPEQAIGDEVSAAADWYAVGTMLFVALAGRLPFEGTLASILLNKQLKNAPRPSTLVAGIPAELDDLVHGLLTRDPSKRPTGRDVLAWCGAGEPSQSFAPPIARAPFVGRDESLDALAGALDETRDGRPIVVWAGGPSGMGKTALVQQFLSRARKRSSAVVLAGRCYERESVPFKAFDGIADALARHLSKLPRSHAAALLAREAHDLAKVFPVLTRVKALESVPRRGRDIPDQHELRIRGFRALKQTLAAIAEKGPLVIVVDDLQWSDADSALLLAEVLAPPDAPRLLFVGTFRSDERATNALLNEMLDAPARYGIDVRAIDVGPLPPGDAAELARRLAGQTSSLGETEIDALARESNGSPLFVAELVRHAASGGGDAAPVTSLDDLLLARVRGLDEPSRGLLELVALAGVPIEQGAALRAAAEHEPDDLAGALAQLRNASLVRTRGGRPVDPVECFHDRVRETVAAQVEPDRRRMLFGRLADALERTGRADPELLVNTYRQAGDLDRAALHVERAADAAAASLAFDRAARLYREALATGQRDLEATRSLHRRLGDASANAGRARDAADAYRQAAGDQRTPAALELRRLASEHYLVSGHLTEGARMLDELLPTVDLPRLSGTARALTSLLWHRARNALRGLDWREHDEADVPPGDLLRVDVCLTATLGYATFDPIRGAAYAAMLLGIALDVGEPKRLATAIAFDGMFASMNGVSGAARSDETLAKAVALCERIDSPFATAFTTLMRSAASWCLGRWRAGVTFGDRAETLFRETCTGVMSHVDRTHDFTLVSALAMGDLTGLRRRLSAALREADERQDRFASSGLRVVGGARALLSLASDEVDEARHDVEQALAAWPRDGFQQADHHELLSHVVIDLYHDDGERAARRFVEAWDDIDKSMGLRIEGLRIITLVARSAAALAASARSRDASTHLRVVQKDLRALRSIDAVHARAHADLLDAELAVIARREDDAARLLRRALDGFERSEMSLYATVVRRALGPRVGGDEGAAMRSASNLALAAFDVVQPDAFSRIFAPSLFRG